MKGTRSTIALGKTELCQLSVNCLLWVLETPKWLVSLVKRAEILDQSETYSL